jgi:hypothetical protein
MTYVPDWERLSDALKRVMAAGVSEDAAKSDISGAIADRKIRVRLKVAMEADVVTTWHQMVERAQGLGPGPNHFADPLETFADGNVEVPQHLIAGDFDWKDSRPDYPWRIRPRDARLNEWREFSRPALLVEVRIADVEKVLCGAPIPAVDEIKKPQRDGVPISAVVELKKPKRGRPAEYNWDGVRVRLESYVKDNGRVENLNELLQKCADFARDLHPRKLTPTDKTIREAIKKHGLDIAANFPPENSPGK